jgi:hypothetical protein
MLTDHMHPTRTPVPPTDLSDLAHICLTTSIPIACRAHDQPRRTPRLEATVRSRCFSIRAPRLTNIHLSPTSHASPPAGVSKFWSHDPCDQLCSLSGSLTVTIIEGDNHRRCTPLGSLCAQNPSWDFWNRGSTERNKLANKEGYGSLESPTRNDVRDGVRAAENTRTLV